MEKQTITYPRIWRFTMVFISHATREWFHFSILQIYASFVCVPCVGLLYCMLSIFTFTSETKVVKRRQKQFSLSLFFNKHIGTYFILLYITAQHNITFTHHIYVDGWIPLSYKSRDTSPKKKIYRMKSSPRKWQDIKVTNGMRTHDKRGYGFTFTHTLKYYHTRRFQRVSHMSRWFVNLSNPGILSGHISELDREIWTVLIFLFQILIVRCEWLASHFPDTHAILYSSHRRWKELPLAKW